MFPLAVCSGQPEETPGEGAVPLLVCGSAEPELEGPALGGQGCHGKSRGLGGLNDGNLFSHSSGA